MKWRRFTGEAIDNLKDEIKKDIIENKKEELIFIIGADSVKRGSKISYVIALVILMKGHGGKGYYRKIKEYNKYITKKQRLFREAYEAVNDALWINPILESLGHEIKEIHSDLNPDPHSGSYESIRECLGYISGHGFVGVIKPDGFVAYEVCDRFSR